MGNLFCQEDGWKTSHRRGPATDEGPQHQLKIEAGPAKLLHFLKHESQIPQVSTWNLFINPTTWRYRLNWATRGRCFKIRKLEVEQHRIASKTLCRCVQVYNKVITSVLATVDANGQFIAVKFRGALISVAG